MDARENSEMEWTLPCEMHQIEPGIIFGLTHRSGPRCHAVDRYPTPPFNSLYHRNQTTTPPTFMSECAAPSQNEMNHENHGAALSANNGGKVSTESHGDDNQHGVDTKVYVNPKQHARIMRRRAIRTQLRNKLIRENKMQTLYKIGDGKKMIKFKSRHQQAKRRPRGPGGQFLPKDTLSSRTK